MESKLPYNLTDPGWDSQIYCRTCQKQVRIKDSYGDDKKQHYYCWKCWNTLRPKIDCNLCEKPETDPEFFPCHTDPHNMDRVLCKICYVRHMVRCDHKDCQKRLKAIEEGKSVQTLKLAALKYV